MKKTITLLAFSILINLPMMPQSAPLIKFRVTEKSESKIGEEWDFSYEELRTPMIIEFDGQILNMYYENGNKYYKVIVQSYNKRDVIKRDRKEAEVYTLKVEEKGLVNYIIIVKNFLILDIVNEIRLPYVDENGQTQMYWLYQGLE